MQNHEICGCTGRPDSYSLRFLCDMLQRAQERKRTHEIATEIKAYLNTPMRNAKSADETEERLALAGILEVMK